MAHALGDALGAPYEFVNKNQYSHASGLPWIDNLTEFKGSVGPHGPWKSPAPRGTGTDDTRYSWNFVDLACSLHRPPSAIDLAQRLLLCWECPKSVFPNYPDLAREQFSIWEGVSHGILGKTSPSFPGITPRVLASRSIGLNYPTIAGMLVLPFMGCFYPGNPEEAYVMAYETAFFDVGYAREATALLSAAQSLAVVGCEPDLAIEEILNLDPLSLGGSFGKPYVVASLPELLLEAKPLSGVGLAKYLSTKMSHYSVYDPFRAIVIALAVSRAHSDDPWLALQVAVNQWEVGQNGAPSRFADVDCYASITGSLLGAFCGSCSLPVAQVEEVLISNRQIYNIDLQITADRFIDLVLELFSK
ncbi:MAG: ADP-ribosylglycohydrolase family protein [Candidatus Latescibacterota bacterium]|nr:ADP-ribosylglycohydrolase family protein [Candidatus Latescibacterota bacterium]